MPTSAFWSPAPGSGDWNTGTNWAPPVVPNGGGDTATFGASTTTAVTLSQDTTVSGITFAATAVSPYTITAAPDTTLTIDGVGVMNNSGVVQNLVAATSAYGHNGGIIFQGGSAGNIHISNDSGVTPGFFGAETDFYGASTAGFATIYNFAGSQNANSANYTYGGTTTFYDSSTAADATFYVASNPDSGSVGGSVVFEESSSAGAASFFIAGNGNNKTGKDTTDQGSVSFYGDATAANAVFNVNGGLVLFNETSTAGSATLNVQSGGLFFEDGANGSASRVILGSVGSTLDVSNVYVSSETAVIANPSSVAIGSLEGIGVVDLGGGDPIFDTGPGFTNGLTIGTNNLSTQFAGVIQDSSADGDLEGVSGSNSFAIEKVGTGTLTLSGASTYTGATLVNVGSLSVTGTLVSPVTVNGGGTLTNSGEVGGLTLARGGTLASTGTPTTLTDSAAATFASGSVVKLDITAAGANDRIAASGAVSLGGATLDILAAPGAYAPGQTYTLLTAAGGLTGVFTFGGISGGNYATQPTLSYTAHSVLLTFAAVANTPPTISGTQANQADAAGAATSPFARVTVTDPDANQTETVTVSFAAGAGTLSGGGFVQTAPGVYSVTEPAGAAGASAAAAQASLHAAVFTPTAGQSATTTLTVAVSDGQATATDATTSVAAAYTPPGGGDAPGSGSSIPPVDPLPTEFQNLARALLNGPDAQTAGTAINAAVQSFQLIDSEYVHSTIGLAQAEAALVQLVTPTTAVAVADYAFFTGFTPTAAGLNYLVHSSANATDLNDPYYAAFSAENRYINFAVNLATGQGAGAASFQANYGALSLADATAKAYAAVFGTAADPIKVSTILNTLVPDGLGGQETRAQYFASYGGDGPNGQGTKAAAVGFLLAQAVETGAGVCGAATGHYLDALAHGITPATGSELALTYGPAVDLVGLFPTADPAVTT